MPSRRTRALTDPLPALPTELSPVPVVFHASTWEVEDSAHLADLLSGERRGYSYARVDSPTADAFAAAVRDLEGGAHAQAFSSGMAAISTTMLALVSAGDEIVAPHSLYGNTASLLTGLLARLGVQVVWADLAEPASVRDAIGERTRLVWAETMANPSMRMADLPGVAAVCRAASVPFAVDSTFTSPAMLRPLEHGVDLVVHSATKYLGGHSDATGGLVVGGPGAAELMRRIRATRIDLGGVLAPDEAYLLHRGLATLDLRVGRACATASTLAAALVADPRVVQVDHPSLVGHQAHELAHALCDDGRYGAVLTVTPRGGRAAGRAMLDALRLIPQATSLGGVHTFASHPASTSHRQLDDAGLERAGILPGGVRVTVGLEDAEDLLADLQAALGSAVGGSAGEGSAGEEVADDGSDNGVDDTVGGVPAGLPGPAPART